MGGTAGNTGSGSHRHRITVTAPRQPSRRGQATDSGRGITASRIASYQGFRRPAVRRFPEVAASQ
jgi:hypothetical protein